MNDSQGRLQIARFHGAPVYLHFSWLIAFGLFVWTLATHYFPAQDPHLPTASNWVRAVVASVLLFASILLHELGHAAVAWREGLGIRSITLFIFGGLSRLEKDPADGGVEVRMAVAGPLVSVALATVFAALASAVGGSLGAVSRYLAVVNFALAAFNLVPAFPLDGGRVVRGLLWKRMGKAEATRVTVAAGSLFAFMLMGLGSVQLIAGDGIAGIWYVLIGWFLRDASAGAYAQVRIEETLRDVEVSEAMLRHPVVLPAQLSVAEAVREHVVASAYGGYPVVRGDSAVGLLCLRDILRLSPAEREVTSVQAAMTPLSTAIVIAPRAPLFQALGKMAAAGTGRLLVMEDGRLEGLLTMGSLLRHARVREELVA